MPILVIGDLHAPFELPNYLRFLKRLVKQHKVDEVISIGDIVDLHTISRFLNHHDADSTKAEWQKAKKTLKKYRNELGLTKVVIGNHDSRLIKRSRLGNIPDEWMKPIDEIYGLDGIDFEEEYIINDVLMLHGEAAGGKSGWQDMCRKTGLSTVFGHYHSIGGIRYHQMRDQRTLFSMCVGCGIDVKKYAFEYAKGNPDMPVIGAGVIYSSTKAYFEPFDWNDRKNTRRD